MDNSDAAGLKTIDYAKDGLIVFNGDRQIVFVDEACRRMLGLKDESDKASPESIRSRIQFAGAIPMDEVLERTFADGSWRGEGAGITADDHAIYLDISATRISEQPGDGPGAILVLRNVTRDRMMEQRVLDSQQMELVDKLTRGIAHEYKNLLTIIMAYGSLLEVTLKESGLTDEISKIMETANRANDLTRRLVSVTRRPQPEFENSDLEDVLFELRGLMEKSLPSQVRIITPDPKKMPIVHADTGAVIRSVIHLALNACEAMEDGGTLTLDCSTVDVSSGDVEDFPTDHAGTYVVLSVSDTGTGMPPEAKERLFEPFFTTKEGGSGLGLCSVKRAIESMNGTLGVYSEPGKGTCVKIYLPVIGSPSDEETLSNENAGNAAGKTILVVDDDDIALGIARRLLERAGFSVLTAGGGTEAIAIVQSKGAAIDGMLLDVVMPEVNGEEVYREVRAIREDMPVLLTSGFPEKTVEGMSGLDGLPCVSKPFTQTELVSSLRDIL